MRTRLLVALAFAAALSAAPRARGQDTAYSSLVGLALSGGDDASQEGRLPEGADGPLSREARPGPAPRPAAEAVSVAPRPEPVTAPEPRPVSAWTRLFVLLLPPSRSGVPELRASTAAFAGPRPIRVHAPLLAPRETEEGVRRGMADMMALMSAGADPLPAGRR
ncbi:MAG: hypothetical protein SF051_11160 [Elusimicrobiota bacterium]|nr:hypothetical protein [Elusimicrobiota bacterium]